MSKLNYKSFDLPIISAGSISDINREQVLEQLQNSNFACIRGCFNPVKLSKSLQIVRQSLAKFTFASSTGEEKSNVQTNFAKVNIGGASLRYNNYPRFFRTIYNPTWEDDIFELRAEFLKLIKLRNRIYGLDDEYALTKISSNGLFSACRLQHYPAGGGFFSTHRDTTLLDVAKEKGVNFFQVILNITESGRDFTQGGAYLDNNKSRFMLDHQCRSGDVLIYDGRSLHGVEEIDPHKRLDMSCLDGRLVALASLYQAYG